MNLWVKLEKFEETKRFYLFSKVILAVSKVRNFPHLPPLRYGHGISGNPDNFTVSISFEYALERLVAVFM
jgi:hypothetical protein